MSGVVYQCLNMHRANEYNQCSVPGCPYGPSPKPIEEGKYRTSEDPPNEDNE